MSGRDRKDRKELDNDLQEELDKADSFQDRVLLLLVAILRHVKRLNKK